MKELHTVLKDQVAMKFGSDRLDSKDKTKFMVKIMNQIQLD